MAVSQRLDLRQSQSLVMTPQLQQAIRLLQLSNLELVGFVDQELLLNPLLERDESEEGAGPANRASDDPDALADRRQAETATGDAAGGGDSLDFVEAGTLPQPDQGPLDDGEAPPAGTSAGDEADHWPHEEAGAWTGTSQGRGFEEDGESLVQRLSDEVTLRDHLLNQVQLDVHDPVDRVIALHLIDQLDEAGYLTGDLAAVAELLACDPARVEATLARLQAFDPPGIFARDLKECLALQLADRNRLDPAMAALLDNLELVAQRRFDRLLGLCGVDQEDLTEMLAELKALDPKPALAFDQQQAEPVIPDVILRQANDGGWLIELNNDTLPRVLVNQSYHARLKAKARKREDREYLAERLQSASWLVKALHQRATTILKVATEIARLQDGFFR